MKSIMIDLDEVISEEGFQNLMVEFLGEKIDFGTNYYLQDILGDKLHDFSEFFATKNYYDYVTDVKDAVETIKKLNKKYNIYICTSYIYRDKIDFSGTHARDKFNYLLKKLPFLDPKKFILASDKSIINCDIKIDDRRTNLKGDSEKYLFTTYHNRDLTDEELAKENIKRVNSWKDIEELLL